MIQGIFFVLLTVGLFIGRRPSNLVFRRDFMGQCGEVFLARHCRVLADNILQPFYVCNICAIALNVFMYNTYSYTILIGLIPVRTDLVVVLWPRAIRLITMFSWSRTVRFRVLLPCSCSGRRSPTSRLFSFSVMILALHVLSEHFQ